MLITTVCSNCDATLKAPESVLGKRVKCTKCGKPFVAQLPGDDEEERPAKTLKTKAQAPPPVKRRPDKDEAEDATDDSPPVKRKKPARHDDDDDTENQPRSRSSRDDDDDTPRLKANKKGKKGKKKPAGPPVMLFVLIGIGALVLIGGGIGVYFGFIKDDPTPTTPTNQGPGGGSSTAVVPGAQPAASTAGWVEINEADGKYKLNFPTQPQTQNLQQQTPAGPVTLKVYLVGGQTEVSLATHRPLPVRGGLSDDALLDQAVQQSRTQAKGATISSTTPITYQSLPGREIVMNMAGKKGTMIVRAILASDRIIVLSAGGDDASPTSPRVKAFFESLKIE